MIGHNFLQISCTAHMKFHTHLPYTAYVTEFWKITHMGAFDTQRFNDYLQTL